MKLFFLNLSVLDLLKDILQTFKTHPFSYSYVFSLRNPEDTIFLLRNSMVKFSNFCLFMASKRHLLFVLFPLHSFPKIVLLWTSYLLRTTYFRIMSLSQVRLPVHNLITSLYCLFSKVDLPGHLKAVLKILHLF